MKRAYADIIERVTPYTMTSPERLTALCDAVGYISRNNITGAFVECGVWRGGSSMAMMLQLMELSDANREIFLFDTFEGMPPPTDQDIDLSGNSASKLMDLEDRNRSLVWAVCSLESVKASVEPIGYPPALIHYVKGKVEETIPAQAPDKISLLRLDTDWYESTRHELEHLFRRLVPHGVLIIDDYGHWQGARKAVDEFIADLNYPLHLMRIDYTGRLAIKPC